MSFHKILPIKKAEKPAPKKPAPRKPAPKKHVRRRPVGHQH
ncbi:hypothetical protein ABT173_31585 [Streptomyces sp. NPDC001795]